MLHAVAIRPKTRPTNLDCRPRRKSSYTPDRPFRRVGISGSLLPRLSYETFSGHVSGGARNNAILVCPRACRRARTVAGKYTEDDRRVPRPWFDGLVRLRQNGIDLQRLTSFV